MKCLVQRKQPANTSSTEQQARMQNGGGYGSQGAFQSPMPRSRSPRRPINPGPTMTKPKVSKSHDTQIIYSFSCE